MMMLHDSLQRINNRQKHKVVAAKIKLECYGKDMSLQTVVKCPLELN